METGSDVRALNTESRSPAGRRLAGAAAWVFIAFGGWHTARAAYDNFAMAYMFSSPGFMLGLAGAAMPVELPPLARFAVEHMRLVFVFYFFASLSVLIAGAGLLLRKAWALSASRWLFYLGAACCLAVFIFPGLLVPEPYVYAGVSLAPEFNAAMEHIKFQLRFMSAVPGAAALWLAGRFGKPDIRREFGLKD
ncbi:MAG: hypothetical protein WCW52_07085 [Elusimicrobiales bacterium]|jgi:hypothetical protein